MKTEDLQLFIQTADSGSISRAGDRLGITPAAASAAIKRLEEQLNVALFIRSTRQIRLTQEGEQFLAHCREALHSLDAGYAAMRALKGKAAGELRISAPSDLGRNLLLPWIDEIMAAHPDLTITLLLGDSLADFYLDRVDLAIRYGTPEDSSKVAFHLATTERVLCASPSYLARFGEPDTPEALGSHNCLRYQLSNRFNDLWEFYRRDNPGEHTTMRVSGNRKTNDADAVRLWALNGEGVAYKSRIDIHDDLVAGRLVPLLPAYRSAPVELYLICPTRAQVTPAVIIIRDLLRERFSQYIEGHNVAAHRDSECL
ncbi:LysR family transcriptional regulator [Neptunomonas marina]|uniref:LysR family transcriptional regulator n=1 Tax=Neptunomonas marina TaxID=1815562 RepID=A0A437QE84_9GAMM|nr:LysR family transcriptional regulator [Neptunomonas marina]RVU32868.1 LysR family transcriptional regulator [Neptunomonas marina]